MISARSDVLQAQSTDPAAVHCETWKQWPVNWSAVWVGALSALAAIVLFGLIGVAVGGHVLDREYRVVDLRKTSMLAMVFGVAGAFFSFVIGGWVAGKVAGILRSEPAMLHGSIVWLVTGPILLALGALGAGSVFGGWFAGMAGTPSWAPTSQTPYVAPVPLSPGATEADWNRYRAEVTTYQENVRKWKEQTPAATRNSAIGALTAMLLGLVGSVLGGWMASGEPMTFSYYRTRPGRVAVST